jgi:hypothetical protein
MSGNAAAGPGTQPRPTRSFIKSGRPHPYVTLTHSFGNSNRVPFADGFRLCRSRIEIKLCDRFMKRPNRFIGLKERGLDAVSTRSPRHTGYHFALPYPSFDSVCYGLPCQPREGRRPVSKIDYNAAKREYLLKMLGQRKIISRASSRLITRPAEHWL